MKSIIFMFAAVAAMTCFSSCSSDNDGTEEITKDGKIKMTIGVSSPTANQMDVTSRAIANPISDFTSGFSNWWDEGDEVKVFSSSNTSGDTFTFDSYETDDAGVAYKQNAFFWGYTKASTNGYYVIYPAEAGISFDPSTSTITATLKENQTATLNTYDPKAMIQTGYMASGSSTNTTMGLHNTCAFLYINLCAGCTKVEITSNGTYGLAGTVKVKSESAGSVIDGSTGWVTRKPTITLAKGDGEAMDAGIYLITVIPSDEYPGLSVKVTNSAGKTKSKSISGNVALKAGKMYSLGMIDADTGWE